MNPLSILHISDLHRDPRNELTNKALLLSLEQDRDHYRTESPRIPDPNLIIVSGDIIHGVRYDDPNAESELQRQYDQAEEFLGDLANRFVGGDRERVIIIPGNHDVSFYHAHLAMKKIEVNLSSKTGLTEASTLARRLWADANPVRWAWGEFCFYEVIDREMYNRRLEAFSKFYAKFYQSMRSYRLEPENQFDIFDYPDHNVTVVGLSSCHDNDPRNKKGEIHPDCYSEACLQLRKPKYRGRLLLVTWHHNTHGGPMQNDYMDPDIIQSMIDCGFSVGFHGHQHRPQFIEEKAQFGTDKKMVVISAGTLCAGPSELPPGELRAYNVLELEPETLKATLHQRRMQNQSCSNVIWGSGRFALTNASHVTFQVQPPPVRSSMGEDNRTLGQAESLMRDNKFSEAAGLLKPLSGANDLAKRMLWDCYVAIGDDDSLVAEFYPPSTAAEIIHMADALWASDRDRLRIMLNLDSVRNSTDNAVIEVRTKYNLRLAR